MAEKRKWPYPWQVMDRNARGGQARPNAGHRRSPTCGDSCVEESDCGVSVGEGCETWHGGRADGDDA
jgi:hypothetical protein